VHHNKRNVSMNGFVSSSSVCTKSRATCSREPIVAVSNKARSVSARLPTDSLANSTLCVNRLLRKALYNGLQYKYWTWARLGSSCNHAWNAASDVNLWSGRQVQHAKPDEALGECWNIVRRHVIQCLQVRDDAVQDHGVA